MGITINYRISRQSLLSLHFEGNNKSWNDGKPSDYKDIFVIIKDEEEGKIADHRAFITTAGWTLNHEYNIVVSVADCYIEFNDFKLINKKKIAKIKDELRHKIK